MPKKFSNRQLFDTYMALKPIGLHYLTLSALKKELHAQGYGIFTEEGFAFHKHVPKYVIIASHFEQHKSIPLYQDYLRTNRIGAKYRAIDLALTLFLISFMGTCSYYTAKTMHNLKPVIHYRSSK